MMRWCSTLLLFLATAVAPLQAANIRRIDLQGFDQISVAQIRQELPLKPGDQYVPEEAEKARTWLEKLGVFSKVELRARPEGQVVDLVLTVVENPPVRLVRLEGNTQISAAALRLSLKTVPKEVLSTVNVALDANVIGKAYLDSGMRVIVDAAFDPAPTDPKKPVTVTFRITELKIGEVTVEPLKYVRQAALEPFLILQEGELLTEQRLQEQQRKLYEVGLFRAVSPAEAGDALLKPLGPVDPAAPNRGQVEGFLPLTYHVAELDYPLLDAQTLPRVDLGALARTVRFSAVEVPVERRDFELFQTPEELQRGLAAAKAAAQGGDAAAAYEVFALTRRLGGDAKAAANDARPWLERAAANDATARLNYARVLWYLDQDQAAIEQASRCTDEPRTRWGAYELLLDARMSILQRNDTAGAEALAATLKAGLTALAEARETPDLDSLLSAYRFYYTALTLALIKPELKLTVALDSPASKTLIGWVVELDRQGLSDGAARQLGRMLTAAGFAAYATGGEAAPPAVWTHYQELLKLARESLLTRGLKGCGDPTAFYFTALCDLLRDDSPAARSIALDGLAEQPGSERLVDAYILACVQDSRAASDPQRMVDLLREAINDLNKRVAQPSYATWGGLMLLAKLHLALRDKLPEADTVGREQARTAAEAAVRSAVDLDRSRPSGWWILGMTQLKSKQPGAALASYQQVSALDPGYREVRYALALAKLVSGDTAGGLAAMKALAAPAG